MAWPDAFPPPPTVRLTVLHEHDLSAGAETLLALLRVPTVRDAPVAVEPEEATPPNDPMTPEGSR
jgi:hypothetical protein